MAAPGHFASSVGIEPDRVLAMQAAVCVRPLGVRQHLRSVLFSGSMRRLRQFARTQSTGGLLAVYVAYSLVIQATMASVGLGMSVGAAPNRVGFVLCSFAPRQTVPAPADRQTPAPTPRCPFCFVAAQSAGHVATAGEPPPSPGYVGVPVASISTPLSDGMFVPQFRHQHGEPRAPPALSA